jgi:hypothetical protein
MCQETRRIMTGATFQKRQAASQVLWRIGNADDADPQTAWGIIDAARDPTIYARLRQGGPDLSIAPLYEGDAAMELAAVAPYLVELPPAEPVFTWMFEAGWGRGWAVFLWSGSPMQVLRAHLRRLLRVRTEQQQSLLFRFYDPGVLRMFLPTCDARQLEQIFGPVEAFLTESESGEAMQRYWLADGALRTKSIGLGFVE